MHVLTHSLSLSVLCSVHAGTFCCLPACEQINTRRLSAVEGGLSLQYIRCILHTAHISVKWGIFFIFYSFIYLIDSCRLAAADVCGVYTIQSYLFIFLVQRVCVCAVLKDDRWRAVTLKCHTPVQCV